MKIESFSVSNFRSLKELHMIDLSNLNIIIGANSSGKSNMLEALDVFLQGISPVLGEQDTTVPDYIWSRQNPSSKVEFIASIDIDEGEFSFNPALADVSTAFHQKPHKIHIARYLSRIPKKTWRTWTLLIDDLEICTEGNVVEGYITEDFTYQTVGQEILAQLTQLIVTKYRLIGFDRLVKPGHKAPGQRVPAIPQETIQSIIQLETAGEPEKDEMAYELVQQFGEMSEDQELLVTGSAIRVREGPARIELRSVGAGMQTMLALVHDLLHVDGIVAIEEPETHLHASLQRRIFDRLKKMSNQSQIFVTTHSTIFLDECDSGQVWHVKKEGGITSIRQAEEFDELRAVAFALGVRRSDVLMANSILLVEGWTEKIVIPAWGLLMGRRFQPPKVSIIQMGGVGKGRYHLSLWNQLIEDIDIPKFILLDGDNIAKRETKSILAKGFISDDSIYNLKRASIEDYYPKRLVANGLSDIFSLNSDAKKVLIKLIPQTNRVKAIQKFMQNASIEYTRNWKVDLAEYVTGRMKVKDLKKEIKNLLLRIDNSLNPNSDIS